MSNYFFKTPNQPGNPTKCGFNWISCCFSGFLRGHAFKYGLGSSITWVFRNKCMEQIFSTLHTTCIHYASWISQHGLLTCVVYSLSVHLLFMPVSASFLFSVRVILTLWVQGAIWSSWTSAKTNNPHSLKGEKHQWERKRGRCWKRVKGVERKGGTEREMNGSGEKECVFRSAWRRVLWLCMEWDIGWRGLDVIIVRVWNSSATQD